LEEPPGGGFFYCRGAILGGAWGQQERVNGNRLVVIIYFLDVCFVKVNAFTNLLMKARKTEKTKIKKQVCRIC